MREIARYAFNTWGREELGKHRKGLKDTFASIGRRETREWAFAEKFPGLLATKYRRHFVFFFREGLDPPAIVGVIHEKRDIAACLAERLTLH